MFNGHNVHEVTTKNVYITQSFPPPVISQAHPGIIIGIPEFPVTQAEDRYPLSLKSKHRLDQMQDGVSWKLDISYKNPQVYRVVH